MKPLNDLQPWPYQPYERKKNETLIRNPNRIGREKNETLDEEERDYQTIGLNGIPF